ncbi:MAG: hypothetical protein M3Q56_04590, partial [Bacteroidota bacterium]|nr:hypothetical protein [Bacteroidota bacterium]
MKNKIGNAVSDIDSTPDAIPDNDNGGIVYSSSDDQWDGDGITDEDDADPAAFQIFDLALILTTEINRPVKLGEDVLQKIHVCNQGSLTAQNVRVIDYLPTGVSLSPLDNNGWMNINGKLVNTINIPLEPGDCKDIFILVRVKENVTPENLINRAEIYYAENLNGINFSFYDLDSNPDQNSTNDPGGVLASATDNILDGDGINDEDDADPVSLKIADLALRKTVTPGQHLTYKGNVRFNIDIFNMGFIALKNIELVDYINNGFVLSEVSKNNGWTLSNGLAIYKSNQVIQAGGQITVQVELTALSSLSLTNLTNTAEITYFEDASGTNISPYDFDSSPDKDISNDKGGVLYSVTDDEILDHGVIDEDDADIAGIPLFDLAIRKYLNYPKLIYSSRDTVQFMMDILNQGNVGARDIKIIDYLDSNFIFSEVLNPDWKKISADKIQFIYSGEIPALSTIQIPIYLVFKDKLNGIQFLNCIEIADFKDQDGNNVVDYDSHPDAISNNDKTVTGDHDIVNDHGELDEDDHDCSITNPDNFDLALYKDVDIRTVQRGQVVPWRITVVNQGTVTAQEIVIVDYIPEGLEVMDPKWKPHPTNPSPDKVYLKLSVANGRLPQSGLAFGDSVVVTIDLLISGDREPGAIINRSEIYSASNIFSEPDEDSTPDDVINNDPGGVVFEDSDHSGSAGSADEDPLFDEDDSDPAGVFLIEIERDSCICLNNAANPGDGQFSTTLRFESRSGEIWFIRQVDGFYDPASPNPPAAPIPFATGILGYHLPILTTDGQTTVYTITGTHISGIGFSIVFENQFGDKVSLGNVRCEYDAPTLLEGSNNVCESGRSKYRVEAHQGSSYTWSLSSGGNFLTSPNNPGVEIEWTAPAGTSHTLRIHEYNSELCLEPLEFIITIGNSFVDAISCIGNLQVSLDHNCEAIIRPDMILVGGNYDYNSYAVMIMNKDGSLIPNATFTYEHVGKSFIAKVINVCNRQSCWTTIKVEDKLKPQIFCLNDTIDCTRIRSYLGPLNFDNCDPNPVNILLDEQIIDTYCNIEYSKILIRTYVAKDASGNISAPCQMTVYLRHIALDSIVFPDSLTISNRNPLLCNRYPLDSLKRPDPRFTGTPTYNDSTIYPKAPDNYCNYAVSFEDIELPNGKNCIRKILRNWRVIIWTCQDFRVVNYIQLIEIVDFEPPVITCPYDIEATTSGGYVCEARVFIPAPITFDSCLNEVTVDLVYPGGFIKDFQSSYVILPVGVNELKFRAYDRCHNVDSCVFLVVVTDRTPPVALCDKETTVSLDRFGFAYVPAHVFDDGSYDDCHIKSMQVRRMDGGKPCGSQLQNFRDSVEFCCADVGNLISVLFRVTDHEGNENTCMVLVEVQDKTIPTINCPHDVKISCDFHFDPNDLSQFGSPVASDNCNVTITEVDSFNINQCREGFIDRIFIAGNAFGQDVCVQRITIINGEPFTGDDIIWPIDFDTTICDPNALSPDSLFGDRGYPQITEDFCDLVGTSYEDHVFRFLTGSDACQKIVRKWKVINWCRLTDDNGNIIEYTHTQVIKIHNFNKPIFVTGCVDQRFVT